MSYVDVDRADAFSLLSCFAVSRRRPKQTKQNRNTDPMILDSNINIYKIRVAPLRICKLNRCNLILYNNFNCSDDNFTLKFSVSYLKISEFRIFRIIEREKEKENLLIIYFPSSIRDLFESSIYLNLVRKI